MVEDAAGLELVSQLETLRPGIKALYLSGYTDSAIVHLGLLDSKVAFLQKPFTVEKLARKIREVLDAEKAPVRSRADESIGNKAR